MSNCLLRPKCGWLHCGMVALLAWLVAAAVHAQSYSYLITDLGTNVTPQAINDLGDVVGNLAVSNGTRAFFFTNGVATALPATPAHTNSGANGINNLGISVGWYQDATNGVHACITSNSATLVDLGVGVTTFPSANGRWNGAAAINDLGQILGTRNSTTPRAYLIANGQTNDVPTLTATSKDITLAEALSQNGAATYLASTNNGSYIRACLETNGVRYVLPTPANRASYSSGVNDSNQVVGYIESTNAPFVQQAFFYDGTTVIALGGFATNFLNFGSKFSINNNGQVVGMAYDTSKPAPAMIPFIYDPSTGLGDLTQMVPGGSGWTIGPPTGINEPGQIIGVGQFNGKQHGYLLNPTLFFNPSSVKYNKSSGTFTFSISGLNGQTVIIQATCDFASMIWDPISTNVISRGKTTFTDPGVSSCAQRSYRAILLP